MSPASLRKSSTQGSLYEQGYPASPGSERRSKMEVVFPYCAGLDVHKKRVTACRLVSDSTGQVPEGVAELQTFGTMTHELLALADWLVEAGVTHIAMESTGEYTPPGILPSLDGVI